MKVFLILLKRGLMHCFLKGNLLSDIFIWKVWSGKIRPFSCCRRSSSSEFSQIYWSICVELSWRCIALQPWSIDDGQKCYSMAGLFFRSWYRMQRWFNNCGWHTMKIFWSRCRNSLKIMKKVWTFLRFASGEGINVDRVTAPTRLKDARAYGKHIWAYGQN